jgi:hypothetical protein
MPIIVGTKSDWVTPFVEIAARAAPALNRG